jgi:LPXTG-site transpeptidase (sortase) family protein
VTRPPSADRPPGAGTWLLALAIVLAVVGVVRDQQPPDVHAQPAPVSVQPAAPVRLVVPAIHLRARVVPIEADPDGVLFPPADVDKVGWWKRSAEPGRAGGQTVLTGHTVTDGAGVMDRLGKLRPGDRVRIRTSEGTIRYETARTAVYSRAELARNAGRLFGQDRVANRLVLITCTDWDGEVYRSNVVAFARPVD